jgi:four helix bundle protein
LEKPSLIQERSFRFALEIIKLYKGLVSQNEFILSKQILRSGTSIGANVEEATAAQSKKDFVTKMAIASKEARETRYWLLLLTKSGMIKQDCSYLINEINEIINIITAIVKTAQKNIKMGS